MRVLTLREPWASLIGEGIKTIETRSWPTNYRGELYIHAGLTKVPQKEDSFVKMLKGELHYGFIFCKCSLVDCVYIDKTFSEMVKKTSLDNYICGDYQEGRYAWILENVEYINPIPAKGHLSIWRYNE